MDNIMSWSKFNESHVDKDGKLHLNHIPSLYTDLGFNTCDMSNESYLDGTSGHHSMYITDEESNEEYNEVAEFGIFHRLFMINDDKKINGELNVTINALHLDCISELKQCISYINRLPYINSTEEVENKIMGLLSKHATEKEQFGIYVSFREDHF